MAERRAVSAQDLAATFVLSITSIPFQMQLEGWDSEQGIRLSSL
jgi:hypothetical protein